RPASFALSECRREASAIRSTKRHCSAPFHSPPALRRTFHSQSANEPDARVLPSLLNALSGNLGMRRPLPAASAAPDSSPVPVGPHQTGAQPQARREIAPPHPLAGPDVSAIAPDAD